MEASERHRLQMSDVDNVAALEEVLRRIEPSSERGMITLEVVFENGRYVRGFIKRGPINRSAMSIAGIDEPT